MIKMLLGLAEVIRYGSQVIQNPKWYKKYIQCNIEVLLIETEMGKNEKTPKEWLI
jgi:hypothetical protein